GRWRRHRVESVKVDGAAMTSSGKLHEAATATTTTTTVALEDDEDYPESEKGFDPRVRHELEILNQAGADINCLEKEIDEARAKYHTTFSECSQNLEGLKKKFGGSIKKARPYFELKDKARQAQSEAVRSARKFQSANSIYMAAKETISLAELRLMDDKTVSLSKAWQEMLNHAVLRVMEAETEKSISEKEHSKRAAVFAEMEKQMQILEKKNKRSISKARSYFEAKKELEVKLQQVKQSVEDLQQAMKSAKQRYSGALKRLEQISECIHEMRRKKLLLMYPREPGVGAEEAYNVNEYNMPTLFTCGDAEDYNYEEFNSQDYDDGQDDDLSDEKSFRAKILTTSLDEEDSSCSSEEQPCRQRSRSLPLYQASSAGHSDGQAFLKGSFNADIRVLHKHLANSCVPLPNRADGFPPDGNSLSSEKNILFDTEIFVDSDLPSLEDRPIRDKSSSESSDVFIETPLVTPDGKGANKHWSIEAGSELGQTIKVTRVHDGAVRDVTNRQSPTDPDSGVDTLKHGSPSYTNSDDSDNQWNGGYVYSPQKIEAEAS
ncbi:unnamed protein product, partial [Lymnaea stagnalis]